MISNTYHVNFADGADVLYLNINVNNHRICLQHKTTCGLNCYPNYLCCGNRHSNIYIPKQPHPVEENDKASRPICFFNVAYALRVLRSHGLPPQSLHEAAKVTTVSYLMYASPAWWGFI